MMKKKMVALLLSLVMLFSLVPVTAVAEGSNLSMTVTYPEGRTADTLQAGDTVTLSVSNNDMTVSTFTFNVSFDKEKFECVSIVGTGKNPNKYYLTDSYDDTVAAQASSDVSGANSTGSVGFGWSASEDAAYVAGKIVTITFEAKDIGSADFTLNEDSSGQDGFKNTVSTASVTVLKTPMTAASATVDAPTKGNAFPTAVTIPENAAYSASVAWFTDEACTKAVSGNVLGGTNYWAKITLTPDKANGESFADSVNVTVDESGFESCAPDANGNIVVVVPFTTAARVLSGIAITTAPNKTAYEVGDSFDTAGMVVTANYDDGTSQVITDYTYAPNGALAATDTAVTVSYSDKQTAQTITVSKKDLPTNSISITPTELTYNGEDRTGNVTVVIKDIATELTGALNVIYKISDQVVNEIKGAGSYDVYVSTEGGTMYNPLEQTKVGTVTINKADATLNAPTAKELTYNGQAQALVNAGTAQGGELQYKLGADGAYSTSVATATDAGTYTVYYKVEGDDNHNDVAETSISVTIAPKAVTITANDAAKTFGQSDPALTATVSGTVGSDVIAATASRATGNDVGEYAITAAIDAGNSNYIADNYDITFVSGKFIISQADNSISNLSISGWTYGDSANAPSATAAFGTVAYSYGASQNGTFTATVPTNAGTWYVKAAVAGTGNYKAAESVTSFTIGQREVTLNWGDASFAYDGESHVPSATAGNVVSGDTVEVTVSGAQTDAGNYTATAAISNGNYKLPETHTKDFTIARASIAEGQLSGEMTVRSNAAKAVSFTLPALPQGASYGTPAVGTNTDGVINSSSAPTVSGNTLSFSVTAQTKDKTGTITVPVNGGTNYNNATFTLTVTTKDKDDAGVTVTASKSSVTYGDSVTVSGSAKSEAGSGTWSWSSSNGGVIAVSGTTASPTVTVVGVGEATITGTFENDDYLGSNTATVTVTQREVTLTWGTTSFTYNGESHLPTVTLGNLKSGDTVTANVTGAQTNAGDYTATVESLSNSNYKLPETTTRSFSIAKASASVTTAPAANSLTYAGKAQALVSAGAAQGGTMEYRLGTSGDWSSEVPSATNAGSYTVYYRVAGDSNHNNTAAAYVHVTIAKADASVTTAPAANTLTYNSGAQALVSAGAAEGGTMQYKLGNGAWGTAIPTATNAGSYTVYYRVAGDSNHNGVSQSSVVVTIGRADITPAVSMAGWTYGGNASSPSVSGNSGSGSVTYAYKVKGADDGSYTATKPTNAGDYTVKATVAQTANYNSAAATADFTIAKADASVTAAPTAKTLTYSGTARALVNSGSASGGTMMYQLNDGEWSTAIPTATNAGTYTVHYRVDGDSNHNSVASQSVTVTIARKAVTITANNATKVYGESDPTLTVTVTGVVSGDAIPASAVRAAGDNVNSYTISVNVSTEGSYIPGNYTITTVPGTFTITPKAVTVKADDAEKTYGQDDPETFSATVTGLLGSDTVDYTVARAKGENVGTYTITASGDARQGNYSVTYATGKFTITPLTGDEIVAGEGVSEMSAQESEDFFTEGLANTETFSDEALGIEEGDEAKQEKRENAVKDAMVSTAKLSNAGTSGLYFVNANSAAASQITMAVPAGVSFTGSYTFRVMYMTADGTISEVPSQVTANGIVADVAENANGVYMVVYARKSTPTGGAASGDQVIITDLTGINRVTVDGKTVDPKYYTVSGSVVTLSEAYLRTLSNGKHTVRVENAKYISTAVITVSNAAVKSAGTGDAGLGLYALLALSSVTGAAWLGLKKRKED